MHSWKGLHEYAEEYPLVKSWVSGHLMNENTDKLRLVPARIEYRKHSSHVTDQARQFHIVGRVKVSPALQIAH